MLLRLIGGIRREAGVVLVITSLLRRTALLRRDAALKKSVHMSEDITKRALGSVSMVYTLKTLQKHNSIRCGNSAVKSMTLMVECGSEDTTKWLRKHALSLTIARCLI
jgi:hypothetical protein